MRAPLRTPLRAAGLLAGAALVAACAGPDVTPQRLDASLASTFGHLYARQQHDLGHAGITAGWAGASADCQTPSGSATGGEWQCALTFRAQDGTVTTADFDVATRPEGCFTATGPPAVLGPADLPLPGGRTETNPVLAFDACFDPSS